MTLNPTPLYPSAGSYVLKLHRDALAPDAALSGRIEHIVSGEAAEFASGVALLAWLLDHAARQATDSPSTPIES
ncbi:MAG: hypothetical protein KF788_14030 [Piscinibacter sp.]|nr:hypothetical protein [Piscinibacter sp.]